MALLAVFLLTVIAEAAGITYTVQTRTASRDHSGTDSLGATVTLHGSDGSVTLDGGLDNPSVNDLESAAIDTFTFTSDVDIGEIQSATISVSKDDAWMMDWMSVAVGSANARYMYNTESTWLSSDLSEGSGVDELTVSVAGSETYYIVIETGEQTHAGSNGIHLKVAIEGTTGSVAKTGYLDNPDKDDFVVGENDVFVIPDLALAGKVKCLTLTAEGDDALNFDWIVVFSLKSHKLPPRVFWNDEETWLSSDTSEGVSELQVCYKNKLEDDVM